MLPSVTQENIEAVPKQMLGDCGGLILSGGAGVQEILNRVAADSGLVPQS